jgi:hypothetical protein
MNFGIVERKDIVIIIMSTVQECYNNLFFTCLTHSNPSNKTEYAQCQ